MMRNQGFLKTERKINIYIKKHKIGWNNRAQREGKRVAGKQRQIMIGEAKRNYKNEFQENSTGAYFLLLVKRKGF